MEKGKWNSVHYYDTTYWFNDLTKDDGNTRILIAQERQGKDKFPYLFLFSENINTDHWWGGRERFGHGHQVKLENFYFDISGKGDYLAGDEIRWMPHYGCSDHFRKEVLALDEEIINPLKELPIKEPFSSVFSNSFQRSLEDQKILETAGVSPALLFEYYQDPSFLVEEKEKILREYKQNALSKDYEPYFDLTKTHSFDRVNYSLNLLKRVSGFDISNAPEPNSDDVFMSLGPTMFGMLGMAEFPGPVEFLQGLDKKDDVGNPGTTGLSDYSLKDLVNRANDLLSGPTEIHFSPQPFLFPRIVHYNKRKDKLNPEEGDPK
jgi:hypothetical protein